MKTQKQRQMTFRDFLKLVVKLRLPWIWIVITFFVNIAYNRLLYNLPISTGDLLGGDLSTEALRQTLLYYGLYAVIVVVQAAILAYTNAVSSQNARVSLWGKMLRINESYYDTIDNSEMITTITADVSFAVPRVVNLFVAVVPDVIYLVKASLKLYSYDKILLITMLFFLPMKYLYMLIWGRRLFDRQSEVREQIGSLTGSLGERMDNLVLVKSFNKEEEELEKVKKETRALFKTNVRFAKLSGLGGAIENAILLLQQFACMVVAVLLMRQGKITVAEWVTFFLFFSNISSKFSALIEDWMNLKVITGTLKRSKELMDAEPEDFVEAGERMPEGFDLCFRDVSFAYEGDLALKGISFEIPQGQKVAIVGSCGSGKSTTLALIERFYEPLSGEITLGGKPAKEIRLKDYRDLISYVPQNNQIFSGTIREALTYGNTADLADAEILAMAETTGFLSYIDRQPEGLDAEILCDGANMSGGQLQKLILTRERLKKSSIVLFDEPTSALDAVSSLAVKQMLMNNLEDKTVIVVTHDLSLVDEMDRIILLDDGTLIQAGTYADMLANCPKFEELVNSQNNLQEAAV